MYRSKPQNRQEKYEALLNGQDACQRVVWFSDLPTVMKDLIKAINQTKSSLSEKVDLLSKFEEKSLPKLRSMYRELRTLSETPKHDRDAEVRSRELVGNMVSQINSWFRSSKVAVGVQVELDNQYYGKAVIAKSYTLVVSDDFNITLNRGWK